MKNVILTLIIGLSALSLKANQFSNLNLNMMENGQYEVVLNNQVYGNTGNTFTLNNLVPGRYSLSVSKIIPSSLGFQKRMVYTGLIDIPAGSNVNALVERFNKIRLSYSQIPYLQPYGPGQCGNQGGYYQPQPLMGMNPVAFSQLKNTITNQWFDSGKLQVAKQALSMNNITAAQVAELMQLFSFENSKLEIAKMAFANTIDKQNYYIVNNEFWFSSSVGELNQYINHL